VGWSPRDSLLRSPELAWLSHPAARFIRLPKSLDALREELLAPVGERDSEWERLLAPLGQWQWATQRLAEVLERADPREAALQQQALLEFASKHWPGWYERPLARSPTRREILIELDAQAGAVAVAHAMRSLPGLTGNRGRAVALEELQDSLCYSGQELKGACADGGGDPGWDEMEADLAVLRVEMDAVQGGGGVVPEAVSEGLLSLERALAGVRTEPKPETVDAILRSLASLEGFVHSTRRQISQIAEMGDLAR
jgi:hypothetical protein